MLLREKNIPETVYCKNHLGYDVIYSEATVTMAGRDQRGVVLVSREGL